MELELRLTSMGADNEVLRAQVDEAEYWVYERGPIEQELNELRVGSFVSEREIVRLTTENTRLMETLRGADSIVTDGERAHPRRSPGQPPQERATITQTFVNNLFQTSRHA